MKGIKINEQEMKSPQRNMIDLEIFSQTELDQSLGFLKVLALCSNKIECSKCN